MRLLPLQPFSEFRGSTGGLTTRTAGSNVIAYNRPSPRRSRRLSQTPRRAAFARLSKRWLGILTAAQRQGWTQYAARTPLRYSQGYPRFLAPKQAFISENLVRDLAGIPYMDTAPPVGSILPPPDPDVFFVSHLYVRLANTGDLPGVGEWYLVSLTNWFSAAANNPRTWYRQHWLLTGPLVASQMLTVSPPRLAGATNMVHTRLLSNSGRFSIPHVFVGIF